MKESGKIFGVLVILILLSVIGYCAFEMLHVNNEEEYYTVSVLLDDSGNERWAAFKEGLSKGAEENHIHLNILSTGRIESFAQEEALLNHELDGSSNGLILQDLYASLSGNLLQALSSSGIALELIETDEAGSLSFDTVMVDQQALGAAIASAALGKTAAGEAESERVGAYIVLGVDNGQTTLQQRLRGLNEVLESRGAEILGQFSLKNMEEDERNKLIMLLRQHPSSCLIAVDNKETELAAELLNENDLEEILLCGTGGSEKNVYYLDRGIIRALIVPNEYYHGYQSIRRLAAQMKYHTVYETKDAVEFLTVTRENLYDKELERMLFPLVR
ncbi:MAG: substrate-binding domain-containing protein [Eubacteriales bacterium]|nr:substrate-binding domain-containing protein [Eubacteriales bacterium]